MKRFFASKLRSGGLHKGRIVISMEALEQSLGVKPGNSIVAVFPQSGDDMANGVVSFVVVGPDMPRHAEGAPLMIVDIPRYEA